MKRIGLKIAILAIVASTASAWAGESAGVRNCTWCHGTSGQGFMVAPRLAGQRPQYIESQLRSFAAHTRDNPFSKQYMWGAVAALGPHAARDLAIYFATIAPKAANDGDWNLAAKGKTIYLEGIPESNIVSCYACHGPNAEGVRDIPRLGGLAYFYLRGGSSSGVRGIIRAQRLRCPWSPAIWARKKSRRSPHTSASSSKLLLDGSGLIGGLAQTARDGIGSSSAQLSVCTVREGNRANAMRSALHHLADLDRKLSGFIALAMIHRLDFVGYGNALLRRGPRRDLRQPALQAWQMIDFNAGPPMRSHPAPVGNIGNRVVAGEVFMVPEA
jgi:cytochrome c553